MTLFKITVDLIKVDTDIVLNLVEKYLKARSNHVNTLTKKISNEL